MTRLAPLVFVFGTLALFFWGVPEASAGSQRFGAVEGFVYAPNQCVLEEQGDICAQLFDPVGLEARVVVRPTNRRGRKRRLVTKSDSLGVFELSKVRAGRYRVSGRLRGLSHLKVPGARVRIRPHNTKFLNLAAIPKQ